MSHSIHWELNPVLVKELRSRMRGSRAFITLTGMLLVLGVFSFVLYRMVLAATRYSTSPLSPQVGQVLFAGLVFLELMVVCAITPSVTAGAVSGEQEKQTYEMLLATPLQPFSILWGKLVSALSYIFILIFASIPMASLVFIFGGVGFREMLKTLVLLVMVAVMFGVVGLFMSALFRKTGRATAVTYLVVLLMIFGPLFVSAGSGIIQQGTPPRWMLIPSPISALASAISPSVTPSSLSSMFWIIGGSYEWVSGPPAISMTSIPRPIYHYSLPLYGVITMVLFLATTRLVRPTRRWKISWAEGLISLILVLGIAGIFILIFIGTSGRYENIRLSSPAQSTPTPAEVSPASWIPSKHLEETRLDNLNKTMFKDKWMS